MSDTVDKIHKYLNNKDTEALKSQISRIKADHQGDANIQDVADFVEKNLNYYVLFEIFRLSDILGRTPTKEQKSSKSDWKKYLKRFNKENLEQKLKAGRQSLGTHHPVLNVATHIKNAIG